MSVQRPKIFVVVPSSRPVNPYTFSSFNYNVNQLGLAGVEISEPRLYDEKPLSRARSNSLTEFVEDFPQYTHYLCIDDDQVFYTETILKLLMADKPIVSAWYMTRIGNLALIVFGKRTDKPALNPEDFNVYHPLSIKELIARKLPDLPLAQIDGIGLGCVLIKRSAAETLVKHSKKVNLPVFLEWSPIMGDKTGFFSEDLWFSEMCYAAGISLYVHLGAYIGHWAEQGFIVGRQHLKARAMQEGIVEFNLDEVT